MATRFDHARAARRHPHHARRSQRRPGRTPRALRQRSPRHRGARARPYRAALPPAGHARAEAARARSALPEGPRLQLPRDHAPHRRDLHSGEPPPHRRPRGTPQAARRRRPAPPLSIALEPQLATAQGARSRPPRPIAGVTLITYQRQIVAIAGAHRLHLAPAIGDLPDGDPLKTFVCFLARYARDVQTGELPVDPTRYAPCRGEHYARAALMPADEFSALHPRSDPDLAAHFHVPLEQIAHRRTELAGDTNRTRGTRPGS